MELLLFPSYVMYYRKRAFSAAQAGVQMEKILLHPIKGQLRPIRGALQGRGIRGDHLAGKMQKFRRQHGVVNLRDRLPLRRSRPSLYQGVKQQRQQPLLCPDKFRQPGLHRPGHIAHIRLCAVMEQAKQCRLVRFTPHQRLSGASQRVLPNGVKYREMAVGAGHQRLGVGNIPHIQIRRHRVVRVKMPPGVGRNRFVYTVASG